MAASHLYLTSTGRLARRLRHRFRITAMEEGRRAWETLPAMTLNAWLSRTWDDAWSEEAPAPELFRLHLWKSLCNEFPPPFSLERDTGLYRLLDGTYGTMVRHRIDPERGVPSTPLAEWRRTLSQAFREALSKSSFFHEAELPGRVCRALREGTLPCPEGVSLAGFDFPAPVEEDLFALFHERCNCRHLDLSRPTPGALEAFTLPTPEQEVLFLIDRLLEEAQSTPLHRIGVIIPNLEEYRDVLARGLKEITGDDATGNAQWFNITLGKPVAGLPLVQAAMLPLRFILEGEQRDLFLSLILSPYYGAWKEARHEIAGADRLWRSRSVDRGLVRLLNLVERKMPELIGRMTPGGKDEFTAIFRGAAFAEKSARDWIAWLEQTWSRLDFPVRADEADNLAWRHLKEILGEIGTNLGSAPMRGQEFISWFMERAGSRSSQTGGSEEAGIQLMGLVEARGLEFDRLFIVDMNDRSMPQPVRPLPLLDWQERKKVQGGTVESQYVFAERTFRQLMHAAPRITLLRAEQQEGKPLTPSPFWPDEEKHASLDIWHEPGPAWMRAGWLRDAFDVIHRETASTEVPADPPLDPSIAPSILSVSNLEEAVACPYRFFAGTVLGIEPLEAMEPEVSPRARGTRLHRVLALFTKGAREAGLDLEKERDRARALLESCVETVLRDVTGSPQWDVERERWLERESSALPGLLTQWLAHEIDRWNEGWRCIGEELSFENLSREEWSFALKGRIDRIDYRRDEGIMCCDYKTGSLPSEKDIVDRFAAPQLPVYVMALREGALSDVTEYPDPGTPLSAGYIQLKSLKDLRTRRIGDITGSLEHWADIISGISRLFGEGDFPARPFPFSEGIEDVEVCRTCEYRTICKKGLTSTSAATGEDDNGTDSL